MERNFSSVLSSLRRGKGFSQRKVAADLLISQALLSHYENGAREPGIPFICRACDYYNVSADYILGRTDDDGFMTGGAEARRKLGELAETLRELAETIEGS
jgi:Predicted transcriptional regulators